MDQARAPANRRGDVHGLGHLIEVGALLETILCIGVNAIGTLYGVRNGEGARVASDTRKGLAALSRLENAYRRRVEPEAPTPEEATISSMNAASERERRARRRQAFTERNLD